MRDVSCEDVILNQKNKVNVFSKKEYWIERFSKI